VIPIDTENGSDIVRRCAWAGSNPLYIQYHDNEWGVPVHDDRLLFEFLILEGAQAGLSWITILRKRENYRKAFDNFNPEIIAGYNEEKISELLQNPGIIRNRSKIKAAINNACAFLKIKEEFDSFDSYIWSFTAGKTIVNKWGNISEVPATSPESDALSKDLKKRGLRFVGPTICYSHMQATGMVNDHTTDCFRYPCSPSLNFS
jgi:DNA-3-methyladenine glycosylase I